MKYLWISVTILSLVLTSSTTPIAAPLGLLSGVTAVGKKVTGTVGTVVAAAPIPALPKPIEGTIGTITGAAPAIVETVCNQQHKCTVTISGDIQSMLVDGANYTGQLSISAWMQDGHAYGSMDLVGSSPNLLPFNIICTTPTKVCTGTLAGDISNILVNAPQIELWGWLTPSGYCNGGVCFGSLNAYGDPGYKN